MSFDRLCDLSKLLATSCRTNNYFTSKLCLGDTVAKTSRVAYTRSPTSAGVLVRVW